MPEFIYPNLFVPGAAKSGTSSLHDYLAQHTQLSMSNVKEPQYFTKYFNDKKRRAEYYGLWEKKAHINYYGESSTAYMVDPAFIKNIKTDGLSAKFIFLLRNPIDRAYSHYKWLYGLGFEKRDFLTAFEEESKRTVRLNLLQEPEKFYFQYGLYGEHLSRFYNAYKRENVLIVLSENLKANPLKALNEITSFLSIEPYDKVDHLQSNKSIKIKNGTKVNTITKILKPIVRLKTLVLGNQSKINFGLQKRIMKKIVKEDTQFTFPKLSDSSRVILRDIYNADFHHLNKISGVDFSPWLDFNE